MEARPFRLHAESSWQMGHRGWSHDRATDEQRVAGRSSGLCGWVHSASCWRSPFSSIADRTSRVLRRAPCTPISIWTAARNIQLPREHQDVSDEEKKKAARLGTPYAEAERCEATALHELWT